MLILAFDTTDHRGSAGIFADSECLASIAPADLVGQSGTNSLNYSVLLFRMFERLSEMSGVKLRDIDLFALANGPGSFTGIRVGVAAAQAWAEAFSRPVVGVSVLAAMVEAARPETKSALALTDARRGDFYAGVFRGKASIEGSGLLLAGPNSLWRTSDTSAKPGPQPIAGAVAPSDDQVDEPEQLLLSTEAVRHRAEELLTLGGLTCVVREQDARAVEISKMLTETSVAGAAKLGAMEAPLRTQSDIAPPAYGICWRAVTGMLVNGIAGIALQAHRQGRSQRADELDAGYIRRSDAEMRWQE